MIDSQLVELLMRYGFACMVTAWLLYERYKFSLSQVESLATISTNLALITEKLERM
jgi:hypothetical protein